MRKKQYTAIDLFSGAGGLTLGLKSAGFKVLAGVEISPIAASTYRANHPDIKLIECDIKNLSETEILKGLKLKRGELDLLAGCPPCQGFSTQRTRNKVASITDDRNELIFEFLRIVEITFPKTIMLENVPGLAKDWRITSLREKLSLLGYVIDEDFAQVKDAANYGVPQRRRRLLVKASRLGLISNPRPSPLKNTVRATISQLSEPGTSGDSLHDIVENRSEKVKKIMSLVPKNGGSRSDIPREYWLECHKRNEAGYRDVYGRMPWDDVAPTITGGCHNPSKGRFIHPDQDRAITLREAALLQTFPQNYIFSLDKGKDAVALMIGNALPPEFIKQHAAQYLIHLKEVTRESVPQI
ncbi:DNA cytosine methyltransferase [Rhodoferax antarcticus]|uniref:Cytosine-specific methyltransferase n=1 Tax=Rhodoferax antarcticus ANT.BR TaxID=1111071 RepID=A0A1Q8YAL7_9BURK|nr:DNA cytosine methyltransferase [Rhodoferax antarcticus]APW47172.1 DNA (cytosine-5-)-methyltransferase [Rhodoferax antarcticus]OLP05088.1 DNA-cytosine methyltransferase family protein [Rhodoferax antarcticus ANT.BR]